jgi:hypothetical protein
MTCCDTGGGWESRVPQATQRQYRKTRLGLSSAVGMDCNELLAEWTLDVGSVVESCAWSWGKVRDPTSTSNAKDGQRGPRDVPDTSIRTESRQKLCGRRRPLSAPCCGRVSIHESPDVRYVRKQRYRVGVELIIETRNAGNARR